MIISLMSAPVDALLVLTTATSTWRRQAVVYSSSSSSPLDTKYAPFSYDIRHLLAPVTQIISREEVIEGLTRCQFVGAGVRYRRQRPVGLERSCLASRPDRIPTHAPCLHYISHFHQDESHQVGPFLRGWWMLTRGQGPSTTCQVSCDRKGILALHPDVHVRPPRPAVEHCGRPQE